jgi:MPBQ/MSBQ methyltransferase
MRENKEGTDYGLRFMAEVIKTDHLHWGYFPKQKFTGDTITFAELKQAQLEYTKHLFTLIPAPVKKILDVGAGLGKTASLLVEKGYQVQCLSNDKYQQTVINERYPAIPFTKSKFEESSLSEKFDMVLMSESVQYLDWPKVLLKLDELLNPGGYLLIADYFRKSDDPFYKTCKIKEPFVKATESKFSLIHEEDITDFVLPTLDIASYCYDGYILPSANIFSDLLQEKTPGFLKFLLKLTFGKKLDKVEHYIWEHTPDKFNRDKFKEKMFYIMQLWQKKL